MHKRVMGGVFGLGLAALAWVGWGFVGTSAAALLMTAVMAAVYLWGARELWQFGHATQSLQVALAGARTQPVHDLQAFLAPLHPSLRAAVQQRIGGERAALPGPGLTPYLAGLLVMLGMLGTFLGMVVTFKGAVFALEGSSNLDAIRAALAAPIKGLGLSFGTSVAGVASSAMLGLLSALCKHERQQAARQLDACMATTLRSFTPAQQRDALLQALQAQVLAMPQVVQHLQALAEGLQRSQQELGSSLSAQQQRFHADTRSAYQELAASVGASLRDSLAAGAQSAGEAIRPVVEQTMADLAQEARAAHQRQHASALEQQQALSQQWLGTAQQVRQAWLQALGEQQATQQHLVQQLDSALQRFTHNQEQHSAEWLGALRSQSEQAQATQAQAEQQRLQGWSTSAHSLAGTLVAEWRQAAQDSAEQQQQLAQQLQASVAQLTGQLHAQAQASADSADSAAQLQSQSQELLRVRSQAEERWIASHSTHLEQWATLWRTELGALRQQEAEHGLATVQRMDALHAAMAQHLASLGASLQEPLTQLLHTACEVPRAGAEVIAQLRQEMTRLGERDNAALAERSAMLGQVADLLATVEQGAAQQRTAIDALVHSATGVLEHAAQRFSESLGAQSGKVDEVASHVAASAIELSSLGEAFHQGVVQFSQSNQALVSGLQAVQGSLQQSLARSDEQLAYYVGQAREVVDLSITAQQSLVEDLHRLHAQAARGAA